MSRTRTLLKGIPLAVPNETLEIVMCHIHAIFARFIDSEQRGISAKMFDQCIVSVLRLGRLRRGYSQADLAAILTNLVRQERKTKKLNHRQVLHCQCGEWTNWLIDDTIVDLVPSVRYIAIRNFETGNCIGSWRSIGWV